MLKKQRGFSLIELMVVIGLVAIVAALSVKISIDVFAKSNVVTQAVSIKGMINQAKGFAMANGVPVLFDYSGDQIRAMADFDQNGSFGDDGKEVVLGTWDSGSSTVKGIELKFKRVSFNYTPLELIKHKSNVQLASDNFVDDQFLISPLGNIKSPLGTHAPVQGAIYIQNESGFLAAVYLSMLGDVKTAIKEPSETEWSWND